jgi:hypothetical protein
MTDFDRQVERIKAQLAITHGIERLRDLAGKMDEDLVAAILGEAARFSSDILVPLDRKMDSIGAKLESGRVRTVPGHREAWAAYVGAGWPSLDQPTGYGGQGLPNVLATACEELFARGSIGFGMLPTPTRSAAKLLHSWSPDECREWIEKLVSGEWGGTICISEADAGSDVGRVRTRAVPLSDGYWSITGEKMWISFGDHDLTPRIGHMLLARTPDAPAGTRGLSLFLVSNVREDGRSNGVLVRRIEQKLGLHGSPTCALGFEGARGHLVGEVGRGLAQLFRMITIMRLSVGTQGLGVAVAASEASLTYAFERRQGGRPTSPPIAIRGHPDVQRQLLDMASRTEVLRGLLYAAAVSSDLEEREADPGPKSDAEALLQWLLPIVKNFGAETGFKVASDAVLLFGGGGYTREWPIEQALRDARVFAVYEGTTGMQALDLVHRRLWRGGARGLDLFMEAAQAEIARAEGLAECETLAAVLGSLAEARGCLEAWESSVRDGEAAAVPWLNLCTLAATGWIALRLLTRSDSGAAGRHLAACGRFWLSDLAERAAAETAAVRAGAGRVQDFDALMV